MDKSPLETDSRPAPNPGINEHEAGLGVEDESHTLLPILFADSKHELLRPTDHLDAFLRQDLSVKRLTDIHGWLWMVGRPQAAQSLHRLRMKNRTIIATEQADLHLTWSNSYIFIKPLPSYLLVADFWKKNLCDDVLHENACGFLLSYAWLIRNQSDFEIATKDDLTPSLLPANLEWNEWQTFMSEFLSNVSPDTPYRPTRGVTDFKVSKRYQYGELRLGRINKIYRFAPLWWYGHLFRGYHSGYDQYGTFFSRNFAWLIVVFAYITVVLTAMQVGLALDIKGFKDDVRLQNAAYGFSVFSMVLVAAVVGLGVILFLLIFVYNLVETVIAHSVRLYRAKNRLTAAPEVGSSNHR
ncbi:hypothetical protein BJ875DRAFT_365010 [Amylocarpus encephaloides]|uniref:Uncharacterized protein n=1 Tax=Amylocarpus encephaloides TaxID=45428 RepID=A0A9P7YTM2_9HELO|nr:hypothetical protein BJ875DRAFT_365010 [Amylocarpus encephaloides]